MAMVVRANKESSELGGHIALIPVAGRPLRGRLQPLLARRFRFSRGDLVFFQGHSSPGNYARAFLEARWTEEQLDRFRQEVGGGGLSSYPHPWLMRTLASSPRCRSASARSPLSTKRAS